MNILTLCVIIGRRSRRRNHRRRDTSVHLADSRHVIIVLCAHVR